MRGIHPAVIHIHRHTLAREVEIIIGGDGVGGNPDARAGQIIRQLARGIGFDALHAGNPRQGRRVRHVLQHHLRAERRRRFGHHGHADFFQGIERRHPGVREDEHVHRRIDRPALQHIFQQRHVQLVVRFERNHGLRDAGQLLRSTRRQTHEVGVVGDVGNNHRPGVQQRGAKRVLDRAARLHDVGAGIALGFQ